MSEHMSELFSNRFEHLRVISSCPICSARYHAAELRVLDERRDAQLIHIRCRKCQSSVLAVVLANQLGISSVGLVTDLTEDDVRRFRNQPVISEDDVLDVQVALQRPDVGPRISAEE